MLAACGGGAASGIRNEAPPAVADTKPTPCPKVEELTALVTKAWGAGAKVEVCVAMIRGGKHIWWLEGAADPPPDTMHEVPTKNAIVDEHRQLVWHQDQQAMGFGFMYTGSAEAADLDGDGSHEALYERTTGEGGMSMTQLVVVFFDPPQVRTLGLSWMGDAGAQECNGTWSVVPGVGNTKRIAVERAGNSCKDDEKRGLYARDDLDKYEE